MVCLERSDPALRLLTVGAVNAALDDLAAAAGGCGALAGRQGAGGGWGASALCAEPAGQLHCRPTRATPGRCCSPARRPPFLPPGDQQRAAVVLRWLLQRMSAPMARVLVSRAGRREGQGCGCSVRRGLGSASGASCRGLGAGTRAAPRPPRSRTLAPLSQIQIILKDQRLLPGEQHVFQAWHRDAQARRLGRGKVGMVHEAARAARERPSAPRTPPTCLRGCCLPPPPQAVFDTCMDARRVFNECWDPQVRYDGVSRAGWGWDALAGPVQHAAFAQCLPTGPAAHWALLLSTPSRRTVQHMALGRPAAPQLAAPQHSVAGILQAIADSRKALSVKGTAAALAAFVHETCAAAGPGAAAFTSDSLLLEPKLDGG